MPAELIRPTALAVLLWREHLLAQHYVHPTGDYYRPIGGGIHFGERALDALHREVAEEIGRPVEVVDQMAVAENIFELDGEPRHQLMFEFVVRWPSRGEPRDLEPIVGRESTGEPFEAHWLPLTRVFEGAYTLYPDGFAGRLRAWLEDNPAP